MQGLLDTYLHQIENFFFLFLFTRAPADQKAVEKVDRIWFYMLELSPVKRALHPFSNNCGLEKSNVVCFCKAPYYSPQHCSVSFSGAHRVNLVSRTPLYTIYSVVATTDSLDGG